MWRAVRARQPAKSALTGDHSAGLAPGEMTHQQRLCVHGHHADMFATAKRGFFLQAIANWFCFAILFAPEDAVLRPADWGEADSITHLFLPQTSEAN
jgi:hypothetical protein